MAAPVQWARFLIVTIIASILIFVLDIAFHQHLAPVLFGDYPAADYPSRPPADIMPLLPFLFLTYLLQMPMFCYLFLRVYPGRGMGPAIWWGIWGGFFVVIPNMQFFVAVDHTTWKMLILQVIEGIALMILLTAIFEIAYRPKPRG
ncbi:hypothetical protein [Flavisphingomonas formosensis]|uniref:hypothetical protein n=1 Tax=Flavisphingomonas formosensis TaxID=861534 RepID=UPI0012F9C66A|nr:hypothetical protein [Sphingomonas formosensis]